VENQKFPLNVDLPENTGDWSRAKRKEPQHASAKKDAATDLSARASCRNSLQDHPKNANPKRYEAEERKFLKRTPRWTRAKMICNPREPLGIGKRGNDRSRKRSFDGRRLSSQSVQFFFQIVSTIFVKILSSLNCQ
jgi:hypothetical protein